MARRRRGAEAGALDHYARCVLLFDGRDEAALAQARVHWSAFRKDGRPVAYWRQGAERGCTLHQCTTVQSWSENLGHMLSLQDHWFLVVVDTFPGTRETARRLRRRAPPRCPA